MKEKQAEQLEYSSDGRRYRVPISKRKRMFYGIGGLVLVLIGIIFIGGQVASPFDDDAWGLAAIYGGLPLVVGVIALMQFRRATEWQLTPEAKAEDAARLKEQQRKDDEFWNLWYVRYPLAILICWVWYSQLLPDANGDSWRDWVVLVGPLILAAWLAREVAGILIVLGLIWYGIDRISDAEISTPGAIIIGALIIAYAIYAVGSQRK